MKVNIVGLHKAVVLVTLYNHALYQGEAFALQPSVREQVNKSKFANPVVAMHVLDKMTMGNYKFAEIDLGAGPRLLDVDLSGFEIDVSNYNHIHGNNLAEVLVIALREKLAQELNPESDDGLESVIAQVNTVLLKDAVTFQRYLESYDVIQRGGHKSSSGPTDSSFDKAVHEARAVIEPLLENPAVCADQASRLFINDLAQILQGKKSTASYDDHQLSDIYTAWLQLIDSSISSSDKTKLCVTLNERYGAGKYTTIGDIICDLPIVIAAPIVAYSNVDVLRSIDRHQASYCFDDGEDSLDHYLTNFIDWTLESNVTDAAIIPNMMERIMTCYRQRTLESNISGLDYQYEAICFWKRKLSVNIYRQLMDNLPVLREFDKKISDQVNEYTDTIKAQLSAGTVVDKLNLRSELNKLTIANVIQTSDPEHLALMAVKFHGKDEINLLKWLLTKQGYDADTLLRHYLLELTKLAHVFYAGSKVEQTESWSLFFHCTIKDLCRKGARISENRKAFEQIAEQVSADFFANNSYAFTGSTDFHSTLLQYWKSKNPKKFATILAAIMRLPSSMHGTPIDQYIFSVNYRNSTYFDTPLCQVLVKNLSKAELITLFCAISSDGKSNIMMALQAEKMLTLGFVKELFDHYAGGGYSVSFSGQFLDVLEQCDQWLYEEIVKLNILADKTALERTLEADIKRLQTIIDNGSFTHDQRRREFRQLVHLNSALSEQDACPVVMQMFTAVRPEDWRFLFVYFDAEICHWSFPHKESHLAMLRRGGLELPEERKVTWLQHESRLREILLGTLKSIADAGLDDSANGHVSVWALKEVKGAFNESDKYFPALSEQVQKTFFLEQFPKSVLVFKQNTDDRGGSEKSAEWLTWLPVEENARCAMLVELFYSDVYKREYASDIGELFSTPCIRSLPELRHLVLGIVNARENRALLSLLDELPNEICRIFLESLIALDPDGCKALINYELNKLANAQLSESQLFTVSIRLLQYAAWAGMDVIDVIEGLGEGKATLLEVYKNNKLWGNTAIADDNTLFTILAHYEPEQIYPIVDNYLMTKFMKSQSILSTRHFSHIIKAVNAALLAKTAAFFDYVESVNHTRYYCDYVIAELNKDIRSMHSDFYSIAKELLPDALSLSMRQIASEWQASSPEGLSSRQYHGEQSYIVGRFKRTLAMLVEVFGYDQVVSSCNEQGLGELGRTIDTTYRCFPKFQYQRNVVQRLFSALLKYDYCPQLPHLDDSVAWLEPYIYDGIKLTDRESYSFYDQLSQALNKSALECTSDHFSLSLCYTDPSDKRIEQICTNAKIPVHKGLSLFPWRNRRIHIHANGVIKLGQVEIATSDGNVLSEAAIRFVNELYGRRQDQQVVLDQYEKLDRNSKLMLDRYLRQVAAQSEVGATDDSTSESLALRVASAGSARLFSEVFPDDELDDQVIDPALSGRCSIL